MNTHTQSKEILDLCAKTQNLLWEPWMGFVRQIEAAVQVNTARDSLNALNEQAQGVIDINLAWVRLWVDGLDHGKNLTTTLVAWNNQMVEQQAGAHQQFLVTWFEASQNLSPWRWAGDVIAWQSVEALQDAFNKAMTIPFGLMAPPATPDENRTSKAKSTEGVAMKKTA